MSSTSRAQLPKATVGWRRLLAVAALLLAGCGSSDERADSGRPLVLVSVLPQAWFVEELAGGAVDVRVMIPPGASPATHAPTLDQMRDVSRASLYVKVGHPAFPFEAAWLDRVLAEAPGLQVVDGSADLGRGDDDPHVWLAPDHARALARTVAAGLAGLLPDRRGAVERNLADVLERIDAAEAEARAALADKQGWAFYVFHPAWGHFAAAYGLEQVAIEEHGREPSAARIARLVREIEARNVAIVLTQPQFNEESAHAVTHDVAARVQLLDPLARDWPEAHVRTARIIAGGSGAVSTPAIELEAVTVRRSGQVVLEDVSLTLGARDYLALLGPNGLGKTTLLNVVLGLLRPESGRVRVLGSSPRRARGRVGYVPQRFQSDLDFPIRVLDVALMGRLAARGPGRRFGRADREVATAMLDRVGLADFARRPIGQLSGGQLQRVLIARALAVEPEVLLLDEPTASLDEAIGRSLWELFAELSGEMGVLIVTHDIGAISQHVRRVACLNRRIFLHPTTELTPEALEATYGCTVDLLAHGSPHRVLGDHETS